MEKYRIVAGVGVYFVTFTVVEWLPVFIDEASCKIVVDSLNFCYANKALRINAYVIMPTHMHAVLFDAGFDPFQLKRTLDDFRKFTGRQLLDFCAEHRPSNFNEEFRKHAGTDRERRFWQASRHPEGILSEKFLIQKVNYIHDNPRRKGLVRKAEDWRYSSAAFWMGVEDKNDVILSAVGWEAGQMMMLAPQGGAGATSLDEQNEVTHSDEIEATPTPTRKPSPTPTVTQTATPPQSNSLPGSSDLAANFAPVSLKLPAPVSAPYQQSGSVTIDYVYDPLYRLTEANYSTGDYYHYTYDAVGNRLTQETLIGSVPLTTSYVYDAANRLTSVDSIAYTWDNNGNLLNDGVNTYTYDSANRLKTIVNQQSTIVNLYNGFGDRLQETVNGNTTTFTMDLNSGLTRALSDGTNTYHYGIGIISQTQGGVTDYFLDDALGSVRQLTDASGEITYATAYDPFGVVRQTVGNVSTAYGYTGEYTSNDLVYLRARHYAPTMGRFFTQDPFAGYADLPQSQNPYTYAINNPIRYTDPSGNCFTGIIVDTIFCAATVAALIDLAVQLHRNGGNFDCVDWGEVAIVGGAAAVAALVGIVAWAAIVPYTGSTLIGYMAAGGLSNVVAGQAYRATSLALSGQSDQIISSFARPEDV
ncbi:MAG: RHS repeat-associated core domain-containing protein [Chloroflexota bacterium]